MSNFELIDDYLTNRLGEQEKLEFERQLGSDPGLKADLDLQKDIIEAVKRARIADLKAMLNNVPVGGGASSGLAVGKIAAAVATVGIVGTSLYFLLRPEAPTEVSAIKKTDEPAVVKPKPDDSSAVTGIAPLLKKAETETKSIEKKIIRKKAPTGVVSPAKPKIEVADPSEELVTTDHRDGGTLANKSAVTLSHIAVETNGTNKKYTFHYRFEEGKLELYGSFDKSLYEILEIHGDQHAVFLYYKDNYYLLNEKQDKVTPLIAIKDAQLLKKLKEYRGR